MEWLCEGCYKLVHPDRLARGLTSREHQECACCGNKAISELTQGETVEEARKLKEGN